VLGLDGIADEGHSAPAHARKWLLSSFPIHQQRRAGTIRQSDAQSLVCQLPAGLLPGCAGVIYEEDQPADIIRAANRGGRIAVADSVVLVLAHQTADRTPVYGIDIHIFHPQIFYLPAAAYITKQANIVSVRGVYLCWI